MLKFLFGILSMGILLPSATFAADGARVGSTSTSAEVRAAMRDRREISLAPAVGYTNESGWLYGVQAAMGIPVTLRVQVEFGGNFFRKADSIGDVSASGLFIGPVFNLGRTYERSWFLGGGLGYSNIYPFENKSNPEQRQLYGYAQGGRRFALNESGSISYKPRAMYYSRGEGANEFQIDALNFSWLF